MLAYDAGIIIINSKSLTESVRLFILQKTSMHFAIIIRAIKLVDFRIKMNIITMFKKETHNGPKLKRNREYC